MKSVIRSTDELPMSCSCQITLNAVHVSRHAPVDSQSLVVGLVPPLGPAAWICWVAEMMTCCRPSKSSHQSVHPVITGDVG